MALTFSEGFSGTKNVYAQAVSPWGTAAWQIMGSWTAFSAGPSVVSVVPNSGSGLTQTFAFQVSDPTGVSDLTTVSALINTTTAISSACSVTYNRAQNTLWLLTDAGAAPGGTLTPGSSGTQQNSQCVLNGAGSSVSASGNVLTLNLALNFSTFFSGAKNVYLYAAGSAGNSGWQPMGTWTVPAAASGASVLWVVPSSGSGSQQTFTLQFADGAGATDLSTVWVYINASLASNSANSCLVYYSRAANQLNLEADSGAVWLPAATPGGSGTLTNSQCSVNLAASSVTISGNTLTLNLALTFTPAFSGAKNIYMYAAGSATNTGWQTMGTWTVPATATAPSAVSVTPSSGNGLSQTFSFRVSDANGASDLTTVSTLVNTSQSATAACSITYNRVQNTLWLLTDAGAAPAGTLTPGQRHPAEQPVHLNGGGSSVSVAGNVLTLNLALTFSTSFSGAKNIYLYAAGSTGNSGWQPMGTWTVPATVSGVTVVSVSPSSGSGSQQTFTLQFADGAGATDLSTVWVWINASLASNSANSCLVYYSRAANQLNLEADSGAVWLPAATPGGSGTLTNSQCSVNLAASSVTISGNTLTLNLALTFTPAFSGAKNIYMYAAGSTGNSGWQPMGTWTVPATVSGVTVVSVSPSSGSGSQQTFTLQFADGAGATDLSTVWVWINASLASNSANSCLVYYSRAANQLNLEADSGAVWLPAATPGGSGTLTNSQCSVNLAASSVTISGNTLTLNLALTFTPAFSGAKNIYMYAAGSATNTGWQTMGTWTVH